MAATIQARLSERDEYSIARVRPAWMAFSTAWSVLVAMLGEVARLGSLSPRGERAAELRARFFPEDSSFVKTDAAAAWPMGARTLERIDAAGIAGELATFVGSDVLDAARRTTAQLREASGAGPAPRATVSSTAVAEGASELSQLLGVYCRLLAAKYDERVPASVERFRRAVRPLDEHRASRRSESDDDDEVDSIDPAVTPVTPDVRPGMPGSPPFLPGA